MELYIQKLWSLLCFFNNLSRYIWRVWQHRYKI